MWTGQIMSPGFVRFQEQSARRAADPCRQLWMIDWPTFDLYLAASQETIVTPCCAQVIATGARVTLHVFDCWWLRHIGCARLIDWSTSTNIIYVRRPLNLHAEYPITHRSENGCSEKKPKPAVKLRLFLIHVYVSAGILWQAVPE